MQTGVRIIGGKYRGKKLLVPDVPHLRPTGSRIRETLFNWLMPFLEGARCLDAFAGTGALGIEALSRGADAVFLLETHPEANKALAKTVASLNEPLLKHAQLPAEKFLANTTEPFDIIFLDPPFGGNHLDACIPYLEKPSVLREGGLLYVESDRPITLSSPFITKRSKHAGSVYYALFEKGGV